VSGAAREKENLQICLGMFSFFFDYILIAASGSSSHMSLSENKDRRVVSTFGALLPQHERILPVQETLPDGLA